MSPIVLLSDRYYGKRQEHRLRFEIDEDPESFIECKALERGWYVELVFVYGKSRGRGYSIHLLRSLCAFVDASREALCLDATALHGGALTTPELVTLYTKFGFTIEKRHEVVDEWRMWREPGAAVSYNGYTSIINLRDQ